MLCDEIESLAIEYIRESIPLIEVQEKLSTEDAEKNRFIVECTKESDEIIGFAERLRLIFTLRIQAGGEGSEEIITQAMQGMTEFLTPDKLRPALTSSSVVCDGILAGEATKDASYPTLERPFVFTVFAHAI